MTGIPYCQSCGEPCPHVVCPVCRDSDDPVIRERVSRALADAIVDLEAQDDEAVLAQIRQGVVK